METEKKEHRRRRMTLWKFVSVEALGERHSSGLDDSVKETIDNFLHVPWHLECFVGFGVLVCLDTFLDTVTLLPVRASLAAAAAFARLASRLRRRHTASPSVVSLRFDRARAYDLMRCAILMISYVILRRFPLSRLYHWIRGQTFIKLYVLVGISEVLDRLACAFGQDALDSLYLATRKWSNTWPELQRVLIFFIVTLVVVLAHTWLLYVHVTTLNVVVNASEESAMVTLLVSNNFSEVKAFVFKKYNFGNLFEVACSDVCERFKLCLFLTLLVCLARSQTNELSGVLTSVVYVSCMEVVSDWLKHCFMTKFNHLPARNYDVYTERLARDVVTGRGGGGFALDHTHAVTRRLGLAVLPLAIIAARYASIASGHLRQTLQLNSFGVVCVNALLLCCAFELKVLTSVVLAGISHQIDTKSSSSSSRGGGHHQRPSSVGGGLLPGTSFDDLAAHPSQRWFPEGGHHSKSNRSSFDDPRFLSEPPRSPTTTPHLGPTPSSSVESLSLLRRRTRSLDPPERLEDVSLLDHHTKKKTTSSSSSARESYLLAPENDEKDDDDDDPPSDDLLWGRRDDEFFRDTDDENDLTSRRASQ